MTVAAVHRLPDELGSGAVSSFAKPGALDERGSVAQSFAAAVATQSPQDGVAAGFQGLPVRIELPWGVRQTSFSSEMFATDLPRSAFAVLVAARLVSALSALAGLALALLALALRRDLADGARVFAARFRRGAAVMAEPEGSA
jgi:hypothetical protein